MDPLTKALLLHFLYDLREKYVCASCNDFYLSKFIEGKEARKMFILLIGEEYTEGYDHCVSDVSVLDFVISKVKSL